VSNHESQIAPFRIGDWLVEPSLSRVSRGDEQVQLELKAMDVLVCLARHAGELVTRQQLVDEVWKAEFISDNTLTHAIAELRHALGDDARHPSYIETIHRRGYRMLAPVADLEPARAVPAPTTARFRILLEGAEVPLAEGENVIGRDPEAAVSIDSPRVSRRHARIVVEGDVAMLEDLGSKNGTSLNGERIECQARLAHGDEIRLGRHIARLRFLETSERTLTEMSGEMLPE
jgi:DNA-binding winged helix-turn-helix (wHTH) protein